MPLFKLKISVDVVVEAADEEDARTVADSEFNEIMADVWGEQIQYGDAERVRHVDQLPSGWSDGAFPYGACCVEGYRIGQQLHAEQLAAYGTFGEDDPS